VSMELINVS